MTNLESIIIKKKEQRHHIAHKGSYCQSYRFSSSHVQKNKEGEFSLVV